jgi:hypothetical protein
MICCAEIFDSGNSIGDGCMPEQQRFGKNQGTKPLSCPHVHAKKQNGAAD